MPAKAKTPATEIPATDLPAETPADTTVERFSPRELYQIGFADGVMRMSLAILLTVLIGSLLRKVLPQ